MLPYFRRRRSNRTLFSQNFQVARNSLLGIIQGFIDGFPG